MKARRRLLLFLSILSAFLLFSGFYTEPAAECTHIQGNSIKYDIKHPHNEYVVCTLCGVKLYTGILQTLPHGNGSNGTCKQCGNHTYTGGYATKNHGDGTFGSGTCPDCGEHTFVPGTSSSIEHPHISINTCLCGESNTTFDLFTFCNTCTSGSQTVSNSASRSFSTKNWVDNDIHLVPIYYVLTGVVEYTNTYNNPNTSPINNYDYPNFASITSMVTSSGVVDNLTEAPTVVAYSHETVKYYSESGDLIATQILSVVPNDNKGYVESIPFTLPQKPAYAVASAGFGLQAAVFFTEETVITVTTYFP